MDRIQIINLLATKNNLNKYLEIGLRNPWECFDQIICEYKDSVDPGIETDNNMAKYKFTSDTFFNLLENSSLDIPSNFKWDIIFIDGLHTADQVEKDINNSLNHLSDNGYLIIHDCNPPTEYHARSNYYDYSTSAAGCWNGSVWKAIYKLRCTREDLDISVVDCDWGCGIIKRGLQSLCEFTNNFYDFDKFEKDKKSHLNLITTDEFLNIINKS
jgi:hypothetical protein